MYLLLGSKTRSMFVCSNIQNMFAHVASCSAARTLLALQARRSSSSAEVFVKVSVNIMVPYILYDKYIDNYINTYISERGGTEWRILILGALGRRVLVWDFSVCLSVCLSVCCLLPGGSPATRPCDPP